MTLRYCDRHGCPVRANGFLVMEIPVAGDDEGKFPPLQLPVPLFLCDTHAFEVSAQDFQTPQWRAEMRAALDARRSKLSYDFENAWLDVVPFGQAPVFASE